MTSYPIHRSIKPFLWFVGCVVLTELLALVVYWLILSPPMIDFWVLAALLSVVAAVTIVAGFLAYRLALVSRIPRVRSTVFAGYILAGVVGGVVTGVVALLMFTDGYDRGLALVLILFGLGIALALGYLHAATHSEKLDALAGAAEALTLGHFHAQVDITGKEQLADVATVFNGMADQLELVDRKEHQLDRVQRDLKAWIAYDLRIPLSSVRMMIETLADGHIQDPEHYMRYLRTARRDINALSNLIDDLFDMSQIDVAGIVLDRRPCVIGPLIADVLDDLTPGAEEKGVNLAGATAPGITDITIDARQITRVLHNLTNHALHRTPAGGSVRVNAYPTRSGVLLEIADFYEGTRSEDMQQILELFFGEDDLRTRASKNTRLSLAMASAIVQAHGSRIRAESISGKGLRLVFTLVRNPEMLDPAARGM